MGDSPVASGPRTAETGLAPGLEGRRGELEGSGSQQLIEEIGCFYSEKLCLGVHGFVVCVVVGGVV